MSKGDGKGSHSRGAPQPATGKSKAKSKGHEQAATGSLSGFQRKQKRKRWHRHLQRVCGSKQIWETLADTGRFAVDIFREALRSFEQDPDAMGTSLLCMICTGFGSACKCFSALHKLFSRLVFADAA